MFPIRDHNPSGTTPYVTLALIAANVLVFLATLPAMGDPRALQVLWGTWAAIPARITEGGAWETIFTAMFLHGGWMHIAGNMLFLWIFGDNMEDAFGHLGFLLFYLAAGVVAALAQIAGDPVSPVPMVGASGAIAGVMGGYLLLYPRARIDIVVIFIIIFRMFVVPAWTVLGLWFGLQLFDSLASGQTGGGVAYLAHVGGFVAGLVLTLPVWLRRGGPGFWGRNAGRPPYPQAQYELTPTNIPVVRRRR